MEQSQPAQSQSTSSDKRVAVLGAGPMGLAVAWQLVQQGYKPIVFEADDRLGGMTASFDFNGLQIERYYHFHCLSDRGLLQALDDLGIADRMRWTETRMGYWYRNQLQDWGNPLALLRFKGLSLSAKIRYGLHAFVSTKRTGWQDLDKEDARRWIRRWVGDEAWQAVWRTLFDYKFYHYSDNLSAAWIWSRIHRVGRSRSSLMRECLGYLEGGSETLLQALAAAIKAGGGEIHLSTPVTEVVINDQQLQGVRLATVPELQHFGRVISTIPLPYVPKLMPGLPDATRAAYASLRNIAVVCVIVKLRQPVSDKFWLNINDPEMDIPGLVEYSNLYPMENHLVYVPFYLPAEHAKFGDSDATFINKVRSYLKKINPRLHDDDFIDIHASRYRYAQPICEPGFADRLPAAELPVQGLWVADTSHYYPSDRGISESIEFGRRLAQRACPPSE
ncbi:MAG: NAD(P)/FAD-dependent oxidoreductase [Pseudohongiella sp.]|uniref:NAD(P)/FAD-dependent oxidoreductase n=1 Tax=Pseudohongiella sp. TaxID=1979412 RepID=UPI00349FD351